MPKTKPEDYAETLFFYEGKDPEGFVEEIKQRFGFDPSKDESWCWKCGRYSFVCPSEIDDDELRYDYPLGT